MGSSSSVPSKRPVVVIIGGGAAGMTLATKLDASGHYQVVVIERRNHFFQPIASLRAAVDPSFVPQMVLPYDKALKNGIVVQGEVTHIDPTARTIHIYGRNSPLQFDHLAIATGSSYAFPRRVAAPDVREAQAAFDTFYKQLKTANKVVIIGGGPAGVELAGEIATDFPSKSVTIVQRGEHLLHPNIMPKTEDNVLKQLNKLNVRVLVNHSIAVDELVAASGELLYVTGARRLVTDQGVSLDADLVVLANGPQVNSSVYEHSESLLLGAVRDHRLVVNEYLQVSGTQNVYAIGDCALLESSQAWFAALQAEHLGTNLIAIARNKLVKPYKAQPRDKVALVVTIGRKGGAGENNGSVFPSWLVKALKSGTLFIGKTHAMLKYTPPKNAKSVSQPAGAAAVSSVQRENARLSLGVSADAVEELARGYQAQPIRSNQQHV